MNEQLNISSESVKSDTIDNFITFMTSLEDHIKYEDAVELARVIPIQTL